LINREISLFLSLSPSRLIKVDWKERDMMNSSGVECEICVVHFKRIKGESGWI